MNDDHDAHSVRLCIKAIMPVAFVSIFREYLEVTRTVKRFLKMNFQFSRNNLFCFPGFNHLNKI